MRPRGIVHLKRKPFVKRHCRAFAVIGFLIVLLTFIVKEVYREKLKELRDSIAEAQQIEEAAERDDNVLLDQVQLNIRFRQLSNQVAGARIGGAIPGGDLQSAVADTGQVLTNADQRFNSISDMLDKLPGHTDTLKVKRDELKKKLTDLKLDVNDNISKGLYAKDKGPIAQVLVLTAMIQALVFDIDLVPLQTAVVSSAKKMKVAFEKIYDRYTYTYWALYLIGWGLGLTGLIYGIKSPLLDSAEFSRILGTLF